MNKNNKLNKTLTCAYSIFMISAMMSISTGQLLPYIRDAKGLDYAFCGIIVSMHSVGNLISSFMAGVMPKYIGRKRSMLLFNASVALSYVLILCGSSKYVIALAFLLTGIARGASSNYLNSEVNNAMPGSAWALNILHASYAVGALLFPIILMVLVNSNPDRWYLACIFMLVMGIISLLLYYLMPISTEQSKEETKKTTDYGFLKEKMFYLVLFGLFFYLCFEQAVIGWLVTYFKDTGFLKDPLASLTTTIQWSCVLIGRLSVAYLSKKIDKRKILPVMGIGSFIFFVFLLFARTTVPIVIAIAGFGLSMAGIYPTIASFSGDLMKKYPMCWSFIITGAGIGSILMPSIIGFIADSFGIYTGMCSIVVVIVIELIIMSMIIKNTKPIQKEAN